MSATRIENARQRLIELNLDALLVSNAINVHYLCGFGDDSYLLIARDRAVFITDSRYTEAAQKEVSGAEVFTFKKDLYAELAEIASDCAVHKLGFESTTVTVATLKMMAEKMPSFELVPTEGLVEKFRALKNSAEIEAVCRASEIADKALASVLLMLKPGVTEMQLATELRHAFYKLGGDGASFAPIIAFNANASLPHAKPGDRVLPANAVVQFDWGTIYNHYCSDCSRVFFVGNPDPEIVSIYDIVSEANRLAIEAVAPGKKLVDIDAVARDYIASSGYGDKFGHGTGHGVGLQVHESPRVSPRSVDIAEPGNIITIEPGIYIPGKGGVRIEDMVLVTESGYRVLTQFPKNPR